MSEEPTFRGGWAEAVDPSTGRKYYFNQYHQTTWEQPIEMKESMENSDLAPRVSNETMSHISPQTDFNSLSSYESEVATPNCSSGKGAKAYTSNRSVQLDSGAPEQIGDWVRLFDTTTQRTFYANVVTRATSWELPQDIVSPMERMRISETQSESVATLPTSSIPQRTLSSIDDTTIPRVGVDGCGYIYDQIWASDLETFYYISRSTCITTWNEPSGWDLLDIAPPDATEVYPLSDEMLHARQKRASVVVRGEDSRARINGRTRVDASVAEVGISDSVISEIHKFQSKDYAEEHFNEQKKRVGIFKRSIPFGEVLVYQEEPIEKALLKVSKSENSIACKSFEYILRFQGLLPLGKKSTETIASKLIEIGMTKPQLRDEIYCQLCKQTCQNANIVAAVAAWRLMVLCGCMFPPSRDFEGFLLAYLARFFGSFQHEICSAAVFSMWRINRTIKGGPMKDPLKMSTIDEIMAEGIHHSLISFGSSLQMLVKTQNACGVDGDVPVVLLRLLEACENCGGLQVEGTLRRGGDKVETDLVIDGIERGSFDFQTKDPLVIGGVIKSWLREMSPRMFSLEHTRKASHILGQPELYIDLINALPPSHAATFDELIKFCVKLVKNESITKMNPDAIGTVLAPNLFTQSSEPSRDIMDGNKRAMFIGNVVKMWASRAST